MQKREPSSRSFRQTGSFVVPIYQRPYVREQDRQWEPLWSDVESTAVRLAVARVAGHERRVDKADADKATAPHFLGAVVLEQQRAACGDGDVRWIVDGQQRLATVQILLRGILDALQDSKIEGPAVAKLKKLIRNDEEVVSGEDLHKVWPRPAEREAYALAMRDEAPEESQSNFSAARHYFFQAARDFLRDERFANDPYNAADLTHGRAEILVATIIDLIQLVVIDLEDVDDAQVIFEALNARNTPLSATDLVKNLLFMRAQERSVDPRNSTKPFGPDSTGMRSGGVSSWVSVTPSEHARTGCWAIGSLRNSGGS